MTPFAFLPQPRMIRAVEGHYLLAPGRRIVLQGAAPSALLFSARRLQQALRRFGNVDWELSATSAGPDDQIGVMLRVASPRVAHPQGYQLSIDPSGIEIAAQTPVGVFYGVCTLIQLIEQCEQQLPALRIDDWPDFSARGVLLDISRDKVPSLQTVLDLIDMLASWKVNQFQLYTEHTFAYQEHREVWEDASPFTGQDILELDAYCRERFVELVPNQNSFGHMHRWLAHPRYAPLSEVTNGFVNPWGDWVEGTFSLCPEDPGSLQLVENLYDELLPHFSSSLFNVNCDETFDLGQGRSKEACERRGSGRVYLDFLQKIYASVTRRGRTMQFWGDIIVQHPDLIPEVPKDVIALEWGYEDSHPFDQHSPQYAVAGVPFYVCPGTSSWCSIAGRTDNAMANLANAAQNGLKHGAIGFLNTDWGDLGHWQVLPVSYLGYAVGSAYAWAFEANRSLDVPRVLSLHAFRDPTGSMGKVAYDLGNVYLAENIAVFNASMLFWLLQKPLGQPYRGVKPTAADLRGRLEALDAAMQPLQRARIERQDAALIRDEYNNTARLLRHACHRGILAATGDPGASAKLRRELATDLQQIIAEYKRLWLARNRPGGLADSVGRLERLLAEYTA